MKIEDWASLKHFKISENWGDPSKMDRGFMLTFDTLRHLCNTPFELTAPAWTGGTGHVSGSWHYVGRAADFRVPNLSLFDAYDLILQTIEEMGIALRCGFGIYPDWNPAGGFHFDNSGQPPGDLTPRWIRIDNAKHGLPIGYASGQKAVEYINAVRWEHRVQSVNQG